MAIDDDDDDYDISDDDGNDDIDVFELVKSGELDTINYYMLSIRVHILYDKDDYGRIPFYYACELNRIDVMETLIKNGADINARDGDERTALHGAALFGQIEAMDALLKSGARIDAKDIMCRTPLLEAVSRNHIDTCIFLIEHGANINVQEVTKGRTPLHIAAEKGFAELCDNLIVLGADITSIKSKHDSIYTLSPLHYACINGHIEVARVLVYHHADIENMCGFLDKTPLHIACEHGMTEIVEILLDGGADIHAFGTCGNNGATPLHLCCIHGHLDCIRLLLKRGADVNILGKYTCIGNALHVACENNHMDAVKHLLEVSPPSYINSRDVLTGLTPLHSACIAKMYDIAFYLILKHASTDSKCTRGKTAYDYVPPSHTKEQLIEAGVAATIERLRLKHIADLEEEERLRQVAIERQKAIDAEIEYRRQVDITKQYKAAIYKACTISGELGSITDVLYQYPHQNINAVLTDQQETALICACKHSFESIVIALLLIDSIDVNYQDCIGNTALHYAAITGVKSIVERLLLAGARHGIANNAGVIAANVARYSTITELLRDPMIYETMYPNKDTDVTMLASSVLQPYSSRPSSKAEMRARPSSRGVSKFRSTILSGFDAATGTSTGVQGDCDDDSPEYEEYTKAKFGPLPKACNGCTIDLFPTTTTTTTTAAASALTSTAVTITDTNSASSSTSTSSSRFTKDQYKEWQLLEIKKRTSVYLPDYEEKEGMITRQQQQLTRSMVTQYDQPPTAFDTTQEWCNVRDFLFLIGYTYKDTHSDGHDKRYYLYVIAKVMNDVHIVFTTRDSLDQQMHVAKLCYRYIKYVCMLFQPNNGWPPITPAPIPPPPAAAVSSRGISHDDGDGGSAFYTRISMKHYLKLLVNSNMISIDTESILMQLLNSSDTSAYTNTDTCPYRYRRLAIDSMYEVSCTLKLKAEATYPIDSIRTHLWLTILQRKYKQMYTAANVTPLHMWLNDLKLVEYYDQFINIGFKLIDDFQSLSIDDCRRYFMFLKVGDNVRLSKHIAFLSNDIIDSYKKKASDGGNIFFNVIPDPPIATPLISL